MQIHPYISFDGRCEEAVEFYKKALCAEVTLLVRFGDAPEASTSPASSKNKIMHVAMRIGDSTLFASDGDCTGRAQFQGVSLSLNVKNSAAAEEVFAALSDGGQIRMPLTKTFFAERFGQLIDRFGMTWMIVFAS